MEFEWDENKRQEILEARQLDILDAALIFEGDVLTWPDARQDYGEPRSVSLGLVDGAPYVVVHTDRDGVVRLITAWKGGRDDLERYQAGVARRTPGDEGAR